MLVTVPVMLIGFFLLISLRETERRRKAEEQIREFAITDALTGLKNRNYLYAVVDALFEEADRYRYKISVVIFDLDLFKEINDTWGHPVGDEVLMLTCEAVSSTVRKADILIHLGGEEFLILMPHTDEVGAQKVAEKVRQGIQEKCHPLAGEYTASFGVAERGAGELFMSLYKRADEALYKAKAKGRNRVVVYSEANRPSADSAHN